MTSRGPGRSKRSAEDASASQPGKSWVELGAALGAVSPTDRRDEGAGSGPLRASSAVSPPGEILPHERVSISSKKRLGRAERSQDHRVLHGPQVIAPVSAA